MAVGGEAWANLQESFVIAFSPPGRTRIEEPDVFSRFFLLLFHSLASPISLRFRAPPLSSLSLPIFVQKRSWNRGCRQKYVGFQIGPARIFLPVKGGSDRFESPMEFHESYIFRLFFMLKTREEFL